jgi:hypothetical protein
MRRLLMILGVLSMLAFVCAVSVAGVPVCTPTKTTISLYPGCYQLVQPGQQDCFVVKVREVYPGGNFGIVDDGGIVFFVDNNTGAVLGTATVNNGRAVGCFKIRFDVDVYAVFIGTTLDGTPIMDTVASLCASRSNDIDVDVANNPALHGCGPSS